MWHSVCVGVWVAAVFISSTFLLLGKFLSKVSDITHFWGVRVWVEIMHKTQPLGLEKVIFSVLVRVCYLLSKLRIPWEFAEMYELQMQSAVFCQDAAASWCPRPVSTNPTGQRQKQKETEVQTTDTLNHNRCVKQRDTFVKYFTFQ